MLNICDETKKNIKGLRPLPPTPEKRGRGATIGLIAFIQYVKYRQKTSSRALTSWFLTTVAVGRVFGANQSLHFMGRLVSMIVKWAKQKRKEMTRLQREQKETSGKNNNQDSKGSKKNDERKEKNEKNITKSSCAHQEVCAPTCQDAQKAAWSFLGNPQRWWLVLLLLCCNLPLAAASSEPPDLCGWREAFELQRPCRSHGLQLQTSDYKAAGNLSCSRCAMRFNAGSRGLRWQLVQLGTFAIRGLALTSEHVIQMLAWHRSNLYNM